MLKNNHNGILPMILIILDGWGLSKNKEGNAIKLAPASNFEKYLKNYPASELGASGKDVGLPSLQVGNSEAGHMNIGSGRVVEQDAVRISKSINEGTFFKNSAFIQAIKNVKNHNSTLHLMGMLSNGMSAHSDPDHILALLIMARNEGISRVKLHLFLDGRDSPKFDALKMLSVIKKSFKNDESIATVMGRFYGMDRTKKWERTKRAYEAIILGKGLIAASVEDAVTESYNKGLSDEFVEPYIICPKGKKPCQIKDKDSVIFFNLRSDRARQLAKVFVQANFNQDNPGSFKRQKVLKDLVFVAMTDFGPDLDSIISAYPGFEMRETLPEVLSDFKQLYIAETEKYAHVTYFFNGGYAHKVNGEDYKIVASPAVKYYSETPAMSSKEITDFILENLKPGKDANGVYQKVKYDFVVVNFAAPDMIGHTGDLKAGIKSCQAVDKELARIAEAYLKIGGTAIITSDHGNIDEMTNMETGEVNTEHTFNPVPFIVVNGKLKNKLKLLKRGILADIAPTVLDLLNIEKPDKMTGRSLIK